MKIATILGARPQFIKAAAGSKAIRTMYDEIIIHTGQHFDNNMSDVFFQEMEIPNPDYNLGISGGTHGKMTGLMLIAIEDVLLNEKPDAVLVYGDTNSTVAGALGAVKLSIPVIHIEAGVRIGVLNSPEEVNRIVTDHCSSLLLCSNQSSIANLTNEGLSEKTHFIGNIMYDIFLKFNNLYCEKKSFVDLEGRSINLPRDYYLLTCHRQENTNDDSPLIEILSAMNSLDAPTVYPVHPRCTERVVQIIDKNSYPNIITIQPVKYSDSIHLIKNAKKIVTDSGGIQCEAFFSEVQCIFLFDQVLWPETMVNNRNQLAKANKYDIISKLSIDQIIDKNYKPFGDGDAAQKIPNKIKEFFDTYQKIKN